LNVGHGGRVGWEVPSSKCEVPVRLDLQNQLGIEIRIRFVGVALRI
jgi:hypothetical protein